MSFFQIFSKKLKSPTLKLTIFLIAISSYTFLIGFIFNLDKTTLKKKIPIELKSRIKDSTLYHIYRSKFKLNIPKNILKAAFSKTEKIYINIKFEDFEKITKKREEALNNKVLISSDKDFVNANIGNFQKKISAKIRLKGDWSDHLIGNKWSFRVKINDGKTFNGLNKFSLQSPKTRNFIWEWIYHEIMRYEGFPALRYSFAPLIFNGNDLEYMLLKNILIRFYQNPITKRPIIKLSESYYGRKEIGFKEELENIDSHNQLTRTAVEVLKLITL